MSDLLSALPAPLAPSSQAAAAPRRARAASTDPVLSPCANTDHDVALGACAAALSLHECAVCGLRPGQTGPETQPASRIACCHGASDCHRDALSKAVCSSQAVRRNWLDPEQIAEGESCDLNRHTRFEIKGQNLPSDEAPERGRTQTQLRVFDSGGLRSTARVAEGGSCSSSKY
eukprot:379870-Rhodomonas_salina.3